MRQKITNSITVFLIQLVLTIPFYTASVYGLTISNVRVTKTTSNSATVQWDTDGMSNGKVKYGETTFLGFTQRHDNFVQSHTVVVVNGINSETTYFFGVESTDLSGSTAIDNNSNDFYTFTTADITPPSQVAGLTALSSTSNSVFFSWNSVNAGDLSHYIVYRNRIAVANTTASSFNDTGLISDTDFSYKVTAVDTSGNEGLESDALIASTSAVDSAAPVISSVDALPITDATARITWLTNENSTSIVLYGLNKTDKLKSLSQLLINHSVVIDSLTKNLEYSFLVKSCDASNNCANSSIRSFVAGKDTTIPFISLSIPRYVNRRVIDLIGSTEPFSSLNFYINNMIVPKRSLSGNEIAASGKFIFSQIQLEQDNIIKIVATDKSGNKNQKIFEVSIDTADPTVQLNEVPSLASKSNLQISGTVNEPVIIKVFADSDFTESSMPSKITGLAATKIAQNSVELHWDESKDKDFSHYIIYRSDSSPIATTKPANFNLFIDALVDSGRTYTYEISAMNVFGNEGPKSNPITVTTLKDGSILNLKYPPVDIFEDFRKPLLITNASGSFNFEVRLSKGDGTYKLKLIFEDRAANILILEKNILLDTKKPEVKIISPPSGALIFENVANEIDVIAKTEPNARVHLFVDRTPFSFFNQSLELSGLPNEVQNIPESQLDAKCRFNVASKSFCSTGADFSTTADSQGNFIFERVDLTAIFGGASRIKEVPLTEFRDVQLNQEVKESKKTTLVVVVTDQTGQRGVATQGVNIGTCWSGNQSWDILPLTQYQSPTFLSTERFAEGTETIYFYFNYTYHGIGTNAKITSVSLSKACGARDLIDPRFNISCQILASSNSPVRLNKEGTLSYSAVTLGRFPGMERFLQEEWESFFKAINNEMTFPFKVRITYEHETTDENGAINKVRETQTTCEQVSYVVDNSIIDPRKVLPDWLLFDFVDFLQESIQTLTDVQEQLDKLLEYVAIGCLVSFGLNFVLQVYRRWVTFWDEKKLAVVGTKFDEALNAFKVTGQSENDEYCKIVIDQIKKKRNGFQLNYVNDIDLKKCFPASASAWGNEAKVYGLMRYSCDRVFGHSSPSRWTETKDDSYLSRKVESSEGCAVDQSVTGQPLRAERCRDAVASFPGLPKDAYNLEDKCFRVDKGSGKALFKLGQQVEGNLYEIEKVTGPADISVSHAIKRDETNYLTARSKSCEEVCGIKDGNKKRLEIQGEETTLAAGKKGNEIGAFCTTVDRCRSLNAKDQNKKYQGSDEKYHVIESAEARGYTSNCFYTIGDSVNVVDDKPSTREECCCINAKEGLPSNYYKYDDRDMATDKPVHEPKDSSQFGELSQLNGYEEMEWSYRYWKEKFKAKGSDETIHDQYHPNRYIGGRDFPACFGFNHILYDNPFIPLGEPEQVLTLNPFKEHVAAVQCIHLAGIINRIQFIKNLMTSMSTCLIQVRTTGRGDAGACKELFTQYLCGAIWQVVRWFVDGCAPIGLGLEVDDPEGEGISTYLRTGIKGVYESVSDLQSSITQEYGNAKLNELLGTGEESIARKICLGAFGYDWELNARSLVDAAYTTPFATLVQPITRSREFLTVDPVSLKPRYEYRASWIINPGCDFESYNVYLTCAGRKQLDQYPNSVNCGALGAPSIAYTGAIGTSAGYSQCDCINLPDEKVGPIVAQGRLRQNILEDNRAIHVIPDSNVRYDHLKFVLRTDRKITPTIKPNCFPTGYDDGVFYFPLIDKTARDIADCSVDVESGLYICGGGASFFNRKGTAELMEVTINGENANKVKELSIGDKLEIGAKVTKTGQDKCLRVSISPDSLQPVYTGITLNGTNEIAPIIITNNLRVAGRSGDVIARGISYTLRSQNNQEPVSISVRAFDNSQNRDRSKVYVYSEDDRVLIEGREIYFNNADNQGDDKIKITVTDVNGKKVITVEKEGAVIEIKNIDYFQTQSGSYEYSQNEPLLINPQQQATQSSQSKSILVELFHLKEDRDSYNNADDCSLNEKITERRYTIAVTQQKGIDAKALEPLIKNIKSTPLNPLIGQDVTVSAQITHVSGISEAALTINAPDGTKLFDEPQVMSKDGDIFEYHLSTSNLNAGTYNVNIKATSREDTKTNRAFAFKLSEQRK